VPGQISFEERGAQSYGYRRWWRKAKAGDSLSSIPANPGGADASMRAGVIRLCASISKNREKQLDKSRRDSRRQSCSCAASQTATT